MLSFTEYLANLFEEETTDDKLREKNYQKLKALCSKYNVFYIDYAYSRDKELFLSLNSTRRKGNSGLNLHLSEIKFAYRTNGKTHELKLSGSLNDETISWEDLKTYTNNLYKFAQEIKDFDCHLLPREKY